MLSFQREQAGTMANTNGADGPQQQKEPSAGQTVRGGEQQQEYLTVSSRQGQVRKSTYLLAVLFFIGLLSLWFMIKKSTPASASASELTANLNERVQIEEAISRLMGVRSQMFSGLEKIVKKFYEFADFEQINVGELKKNPFKTDRFPMNPGEKMSIAIHSDFELLSIMKTERGNCCMINYKVLYEGDSIRGLEVYRITDKDVRLRNGEVEIVLKLSEGF